MITNGSKGGVAILRKIYTITRLSIIIIILLALLTGVLAKAHKYKFNIKNVLPPSGPLLKPLLVPRPPGSATHRKVQSFIQDHFLRLGWHFEMDKFQRQTVLGPMEFTNLVATADPSASNRIILAAHYDSKVSVQGSDGRYQEEGGFIGATDSAWSCALLLELASSIPTIALNETTVQIIFFDGEEALVDWNQNDSLYGSKHLAELWKVSKVAHKTLVKVHYMILLDLLGAAKPNLFSFYRDTDKVFFRLAEVEGKLRKQNSLQTNQTILNTSQFAIGNHGEQYAIEDDHVPFHRLGVPIVHIIPLSFPSVWHTMADDVTALDFNTCHDLGLIFHSFIQTELTTSFVL